MSVATDEATSVDVDLDAQPRCEFLRANDGRCGRPAAWSATVLCPGGLHQILACEECHAKVLANIAYYGWGLRVRCERCNVIVPPPVYRWERL